MDGGEDQPAEGEPPDEDEHEGVDVGRRDSLVDGANLWEGSRRKLEFWLNMFRLSAFGEQS